MATTLSQNALRWTLTPIILAALTATAAAGSFTRGCAARDMQVLMMIEERENTRTVSADQVREAMHQLLHARIVCNEGYVSRCLGNLRRDFQWPHIHLRDARPNAAD